MVLLGRVSGVFGVKGWVKVFSDTDPRDGILQYSPWYLSTADGWEARRLLDGQTQGKGIVAKLEGCNDRDQALALIGSDIAITREQLPEPEAGEYYWSDLEGLRVITVGGLELGKVSHLFATGANDVLVVKGERERLLPFVWDQVIQSVDLEAGEMRVDWDPDF
jgi:16S rRNA processing protein RimM